MVFSNCTLSYHIMRMALASSENFVKIVGDLHLTCIVAAMISEVMPGTWTTKIPRMIPNGLMKHIRTR